MAEEIIGGYRLQNLIMTGQTSQVWEVVEASSHRHFAMKILLPEHAGRGDSRAALIHEAKVGQKLAHPNIIRIVNVSTESKTPFFVMEFFPAGSLKMRLIRKQLDFIREHVESIFKQSATALAFMNAEGWVHRDVKPGNMLVNSAGELKLIDFALAKRIEKPSFFSKFFKRHGKVAGTRSYMSPEQIRGEPLDGQADVYSFGATCFELVTGRPPFSGSSSQDLLAKHITEKVASPRIHNPDITEPFADLVMRMLAKQKKDRPRDFHEVLMKLKTLKVFKNTDPKPAGKA